MLVPVAVGVGPGAATLAPKPSAADSTAQRCVSVSVTTGPALDVKIFSCASASDAGAGEKILTSTAESAKRVHISSTQCALPSIWCQDKTEVAVVDSAFDESRVWRTWVCAFHCNSVCPAIWIGMFSDKAGVVELVEMRSLECPNLKPFFPSTNSTPPASRGASSRIPVQAVVSHGPVFAFTAAGKIAILNLDSRLPVVVALPDMFPPIEDKKTSVSIGEDTPRKDAITGRRESIFRTIALCRMSRSTRSQSGLYFVASTMSLIGPTSSGRHVLGQVDLRTATAKVVGPVRTFIGVASGHGVPAPALGEERSAIYVSGDSFAGVLLVVWYSGRLSYVDSSSGNCIRQCEQLPAHAHSVSRIDLSPDYHRAVAFCKPMPPNCTLQVWAVHLSDRYGECRIQQVSDSQGIPLSLNTRDVVVEYVSEKLFASRPGSNDFGSFSVGFNAYDIGIAGVGADIVKGAQLPWSGPIGNHSSELARVLRGLQGRLRLGVEALAEADVVFYEKRSIVDHARGLLGSIASNRTAPSPADIFLSPLCSLVDDSFELQARVSVETPDNAPMNGKLFVPLDGGAERPLHARNCDDLIRVIRAEHFVESRGTHLTVVVEGVVVGRGGFGVGKESLPRTHRQLSGQGSSCTEENRLLWLEIQVGNSISATWEATDVVIEGRNRRYCLYARTSIAHMIALGSSGLTNVHADIRAMCSNGQTQYLGSFAGITGLLEATMLMSPSRNMCREWWSAYGIAFSISIDVVAQGPGAAALRSKHNSAMKARRPCFSDFLCGENISRFAILAPDGFTLAAAAADFQATGPEGLTVGIAPVSFAGVLALDRASDQISAELEASRKCTRQTSSSKATLFCKLFRQQAETEDAMGILEESFPTPAQLF